MDMEDTDSRRNNTPLMVSESNVPPSSDIIHTPEFENLSDYTLFRRRHPQRSNTPVRILRNWHIELVGASQVPQLCVVGVYRDTVIRTSPIVRTVGPRRILTSNCTYILADPSKVLDYTVANGLNELFVNGFPANWKVLLSEAFAGSSALDRKSSSSESSASRHQLLAPLPYQRRSSLIHSLEPEEKKRKRKKLPSSNASDARTMSEPVRSSYGASKSGITKTEIETRRSSEGVFRDGRSDVSTSKIVDDGPESVPKTTSQKEKDYKVTQKIPCEALHSVLKEQGTLAKRASEPTLNDKVSVKSRIPSDYKGDESKREGTRKRAYSEPTRGEESSTMPRSCEEASEHQDRVIKSWQGETTAISEHKGVEKISEIPKQSIADSNASFKDTSSLSSAVIGSTASDSISASSNLRSSISTRQAGFSASPARSSSVPDACSEAYSDDKKSDNENDGGDKERASVENCVALSPQYLPSNGLTVIESQGIEQERVHALKDTDLDFSAGNCDLSASKEEKEKKDVQESLTAPLYDSPSSKAHSTAPVDKTSPTPSSKISEGDDVADADIEPCNRGLEKDTVQNACEVDLTPIDKPLNSDMSKRKASEDSERPREEVEQAEHDSGKEMGSSQGRNSAPEKVTGLSEETFPKGSDTLESTKKTVGSDASFFAGIEMPSDLLSSSITNDTSIDNISERETSSRISPYVTVGEAVKGSLILKKKNMHARRQEKHLINGTGSNGTVKEHDAQDESQEKIEQRHPEEFLAEVSAVNNSYSQEVPKKIKTSSKEEEDNEKEDQLSLKPEPDHKIQPGKSLIERDKANVVVEEMSATDTRPLASPRDQEHSSDPEASALAIISEGSAAVRNVLTEIRTEDEKVPVTDTRLETSEERLDSIKEARQEVEVKEEENKEEKVVETSQGVKDAVGSSDVSGSLGSVESLEVNPAAAVAAQGQEEETALLSNVNEGSSTIKIVENNWVSCAKSTLSESVHSLSEATEGENGKRDSEEERSEESKEDDGSGACSGDSEERFRDEAGTKDEEDKDSQIAPQPATKRPSIVLKAIQSQQSTASNESTKTTHTARHKKKRSYVCMPKKKKKSVSGSKGRT